MEPSERAAKLRLPSDKVKEMIGNDWEWLGGLKE